MDLVLADHGSGASFHLDTTLVIAIAVLVVAIAAGAFWYFRNLKK